MNDAFLRLLLILIAAITVVSGLVQLVAPDFVLGMIGASLRPPAPHLFATIGMFMLITGAMFLQTLLTRSSERAVPLWIGVQKVAACALVGLGVARGLFGMMALGVAGFDLISGLLAFLFLMRLGR